ncbi:MAG: RNA polymerase sigma factor [Bacteroidales bacterium]|jgi:RNA polymerase sigma-70 factor (ECF subfamily)|nr:RNA polymerase sigma factor [Bacteroidales bacterium]
MNYKGDIFYLNEVLRGNTSAYTFIVDRYQDKVFNLAMRICGNREEAEEISQDAFLKAFRALPNFRFESGYATWLYKIVYNTSISYLRSGRKEKVSLEDLPAEKVVSAGYRETEEVAEMEHRKLMVNYALQKLGDEEKAIITLYYYEDMSVEEISEITSLTRDNVKIRLFRSRKKMLETIRNIETLIDINHG